MNRQQITQYAVLAGVIFIVVAGMSRLASLIPSAAAQGASAIAQSSQAFQQKVIKHLKGHDENDKKLAAGLKDHAAEIARLKEEQGKYAPPPAAPADPPAAIASGQRAKIGPSLTTVANYPPISASGAGLADSPMTDAMKAMTSTVLPGQLTDFMTGTTMSLKQIEDTGKTLVAGQEKMLSGQARIEQKIDALDRRQRARLNALERKTQQR
jgi:hypothetical protein